MGPTRTRDLLIATVVVGIGGYLLMAVGLYRWFPPVTVVTGISLLVVGVAEFGWGYHVRAKIAEGEIGDARGWLHPLSVARSVVVAKASAWVGAVALGWWVGVLAYVLPRRSGLRVAAEDTPGVVVATVSALALAAAALWLQHCCKSPPGPPHDPDKALE